jgi:hypothetical protein
MRAARKLLTLSFVLIVVLGALLALLLSASVYTYHALTSEAAIAELRFDQSGDREYLARLRTGDGCEERTFPIRGDQWRIDAAFLKWKYWALLLGLDSQYRLDRLSGRYRDVAEQNARPDLAHDLGDETALDIVNVANALGRLNFLLDATYGASTYEDIATDKVFTVYRTTTGIIARSAPRTTQAPAAPLAVAINRACGAAQPTWRKASNWVDDRLVAVRHVLR